MGAFEEKEAAKSSLPADLPNVKEAAAQHPDGAIYRADNGKRYRLRQARWVEVVARQPKNSDKSKTATAPAAKK
jgi:hypothetical protein